MQDALLKDKLKNPSIYKEKTKVFIRWVAPPLGWVLLNTDEVSRGNPVEAGGGGILRDSRGCFLRAFAKNYGICTVTRSEILALLRGIIMARDVGIRKLIIKVDSQVVVRLMEGEIIHHSHAFYIVKKCRNLPKSLD
ncbi:non-LTR retroelement reverse transcriptase [Tanacetum coccineum]